MEVILRHARRAKTHAVTAAKAVHHHAFRTPRLIALSLTILVVLIIVAVQLLWPTDKVVLFASVDGISVGGLTKDEATKKLNDAYAETNVPIFLSDDPSTPKESPSLSDLGIRVENDARIAALDYPWYWRIVPTSGAWFFLLANSGESIVQRDDAALTAYIAKTFGEDCRVEPMNATVVAKNDDLAVVPEKSGARCDKNELQDALRAVQGRLNQAGVTVNGETIPAAITAVQAEELRTQIIERIGDELVFEWQGAVKSVPAKNAYTWVTVGDESGVLRASLNDAARTWLADSFTSNVAIAAGVTQVTTRDFVETSRVNGASGRAIDVDASVAGFDALLAGDVSRIPVQSKVVAPTIQYTRSYSPTDTGLSALMKNFAESRPGVYGIRLIELSGARRNASYNGDRQFTTASTYKLFVAYSTLLRIESGAWNWSDQITGGRDVARCFDDMIVKSDNPCADALLRKIGFTQITNEAKAIGASRTSFLGSDGIKSTANDEALLLSLLQTGQILSQQSSRNTFINALQRNVYRQGIPKGIPSATVANKVGFLDALLHDAAIVTAPTGTYVLVILTDNSSWANIADLAREIETLRIQ